MEAVFSIGDVTKKDFYEWFGTEHREVTTQTRTINIIKNARTNEGKREGERETHTHTRKSNEQTLTFT